MQGPFISVALAKFPSEEPVCINCSMWQFRLKGMVNAHRHTHTHMWAICKEEMARPKKSHDSFDHTMIWFKQGQVFKMSTKWKYALYFFPHFCHLFSSAVFVKFEWLSAVLELGYSVDVFGSIAWPGHSPDGKTPCWHSWEWLWSISRQWATTLATQKPLTALWDCKVRNKVIQTIEINRFPLRDSFWVLWTSVIPTCWILLCGFEKSCIVIA